MNIKLVMPMAGDGSRFKNIFPNTPKPLIKVIPVNNKPMFQYCEEQIGIDFIERIFIVRKEHNIAEKVKEIYPNSTVVEINGLTKGAADTLLQVKEHIDDDCGVFVANCDQHVIWDVEKVKTMIDSNVDGIIATFKEPSRDTKWSYAKTDIEGNVIEVAEKKAISDNATVGFYYWKSGKQLLKNINDLMNADDRTNGEFYTCPIFNYTIKDGCSVKILEVEEMKGLGTPDDLDWFSASYNKMQPIKEIDLNGVSFPIFKGPVACLSSGGADSSLVVYNLLKNYKEHVHVFSLGNNALANKNIGASISVVNKCIELTGNHNVTHHIIHAEGDKPDGPWVLFDIIKEYKEKLGFTVCYIGVTANPPKEIQDNFKYPDWKDPSRDVRHPTFIEHTPFGPLVHPWINVDKKVIGSIYSYQTILDSLFPHTYSCEWYPRDGNDPGMEHCGECWWCEERLYGFGRLK